MLTLAAIFPHDELRGRDGVSSFFHQIHYLFENRLSDKFYFCNFTHVVFDFRKNQDTTSGGDLW